MSDELNSQPLVFDDRDAVDSVSLTLRNWPSPRAGRTLPPIWRRFRPIGVAGSAELDWPFWGRLGSLRAHAGWRQVLLLVLPLLTWLIELLNTALCWATLMTTPGEILAKLCA